MHHSHSLMPSIRSRFATGLAPAAAALLATIFYAASLAPGLTWAHQGADGGELLAAAVSNGVPHPPGYPLYIPLLQAWLALSGFVAPGSDLAWRGNLFSALCAAASVGVTVVVARSLVHEWPRPGVWAFLAGMAWAVSPLLWSQAVITEVYGLNALIVALLGWSILVNRRAWVVGIPVALGLGHHLTTLLLLPAVVYWLYRPDSSAEQRRQGLLAVGGGLCVGALLYRRIPLVASQGPPINWGYADNWAGFWWLVSGAAYRGYLFAASPASLLTRVAAWANTLVSQFTLVGFAFALVGLATWDRTAPRLRNFSLLWLGPVSLYAIAYGTRDSDIYLLPVVWLMALWLAVGLARSAGWLAGRSPNLAPASNIAFAGLVGALLIGVTVWRWPTVALATDREAVDYLHQVAAVVAPASIVVTREDRETFALWYGVWGSGELLRTAPGLTPINDSLTQFDWYRRHLADLVPAPVDSDTFVTELIAANRAGRPIYFTHLPEYLPEDELTQVGPLWRLKAGP